MDIVTVITRLLFASLSGVAIGYERGRHGRAAGLRTHVLVSVGAALCAMVGTYMTANGQGDPTRISSNVVTGLGFIGAGIIILRGSNKITGLTTAAGLWTTAITGLAYGAGFYSAAITASIIVMISLTIMTKMEVNQKKDYQFYIEIDDVTKTNEIFEQLHMMYPTSHSSDVLHSKSGLPNHVGLTINIPDETESKGIQIVKDVLAIPNVVFIVKE
ncbi:MAG: MgtC/SapB family protein [Eubacteriales bacterium]|nr:MgtC/SapB family protein [Eubacteriales bacterium]